MSFASELDSYCRALGLTGNEIAAACGLSASTLSRYRSGARRPRAGDGSLEQIACGLAELFRQHGQEDLADQDAIATALRADKTEASKAGQTRRAHMEKVIALFRLRNADIAAEAGVDPSYVSRIRKGERVPADRMAFARAMGRCVAKRCLSDPASIAYLHLLSQDGATLVPAGTSQHAANGQTMPETAKGIALFVANYLMSDPVGSNIYTVLANMLLKADAFDPASLEEQVEAAQRIYPARAAHGKNVSRFYYGLEQAREAELDFLSTVLASEDPGTVFLGTTFSMHHEANDEEFTRTHQALMAALIRRGARINITHSLKRPLNQIAVGMDYWMPLYLSGSIHAFEGPGGSGNAFTRLNYVANNCALTAEGMREQPESCHYHLVANPEEVAFYRMKTEHSIALSRPLLTPYRMDAPEEVRAFAALEAELEARTDSAGGAELVPGAFRHLRFVQYPGQNTLIYADCGHGVRFHSAHPRVPELIREACATL